MEKPTHIEEYNFAQRCLQNKDIDGFCKEYKKSIESTISKRLYGEFSSYLDDVFQELIIFLFYKGGLEKYEGRSKLSTWLFTVTLRRTIDFVRGLTSRKEISFNPEKHGRRVGKDRAVTQKILEEETALLVRKTLKELRQEWSHEKIVYMEKHHMAGLTYNQLGKIFKKKWKTVYNHVQEAEQKFRDTYSDISPNYEEGE